MTPASGAPPDQRLMLQVALVRPAEAAVIVRAVGVPPGIVWLADPDVSLAPIAIVNDIGANVPAVIVMLTVLVVA